MGLFARAILNGIHGVVKLAARALVRTCLLEMGRFNIMPFASG